MSTWHEFDLSAGGMFCGKRGCGLPKTDPIHRPPAQRGGTTEEAPSSHAYRANPPCCTFPVDSFVHIESRYAHAPGAHTLDEAFEEFHRNNPRVYTQLVELARKAKGKGFQHYGIAALFEILRWEAGPTTNDDDGFKLNNNLKAIYARRIMAEHSDLAGFFRTRARSNEEENEHAIS